MPEVLEVRSTGQLAGTRSITRIDVQPISSRSTRPVSVQDVLWDTAITLLGRRQDGETVIEANSATVVCSGVALAAVGALANSFTLTNLLSSGESLSPPWHLADFAYAEQHVSDFDQPKRAEFPVSHHHEGFTALYNIVSVPSHVSRAMFTHLPFGDVAALGASWLDRDDLEFGVIRQGGWPTGPHSRGGQDTDVSQKNVFYSSAEVADAGVTQTFDKLVATWKAERSGVYSGSEIFVHPAYQKIIGLGIGAVRLILRELERELDHWFWALAAITREDPVPPEFKGNMLAMREYWLNWGRRQGYKW
jgi:hypothetical protein